MLISTVHSPAITRQCSSVCSSSPSGTFNVTVADVSGGDRWTAFVRRGHFLIHVGCFQLAVFHLHAISIVRSVRLVAGQLVAPPLRPVDRQEPIPADVKRGPVKLVTMQEMSLPNQGGSLNRG